MILWEAYLQRIELGLSDSTIQHSILNSKVFYIWEKTNQCLWFLLNYTGLCTYQIFKTLVVFGIPFQKFVESLSSELTFRLKLKLDPRLHFEFVPAGIIGRLLEIKTIRPSTFSTNMYSVSWILTLVGINLSVKVKQNPKPDTLFVNLGFRIRLLTANLYF